MSNSQWSNEQPPAWQGPNAPAYKAEPPTPPTGWKEQRLSVLLGLTWGLFSSNVKKFLLTNFAVVGVGVIATLLILRLFPVELSTLSQALLDGDTKPLDDALKGADIDAQSKIIVDAVIPILQMFALTLPIISITSLVASAFSTKVALENSDESSSPSINWLKMLTASLATSFYFVVGFIPLVAFAIAMPSMVGIAVILLIPYLFWIGLGLAMVYPIVIAENLGGFKAIKRSLVLSSSNRKRIFAVVIIVGILASLPGAALNQFMLLIPSTVLNYVEVTSLANFAGMLISVPITSSGVVILYRYLHAKFHS
jgi:hypothetical protein